MIIFIQSDGKWDQNEIRVRSINDKLISIIKQCVLKQWSILFDNLKFSYHEFCFFLRLSNSLITNLKLIYKISL